jgi:hypothetical protein
MAASTAARTLWGSVMSRATTFYDHRRSFDRHAAYVVVAFVAGG